ncbi:MAG: ABC transporter substrate-binding protein [Chloroflexota bacterium]|nr:ABC transporter substrate-binding protein [Chloroflexota bacterium]
MPFPRSPIAMAVIFAVVAAAFVVPRSAGAHAVSVPVQTLTAAFHDDFSTMDPAIGYDPFSWTGEHAVLDTLLGYANAPGKAGTKLVPDIAAGMPSITDNGRLYTFQLRHDVHFSRPVNRLVTASDIRYSIERTLAKATAGPMYQSPFWSPLHGTAAFWAGKTSHVSGIQVLGPHAIRFRLDSPDLAFENILAMPFAAVVPVEQVRKYGKNFSDHVIGTGPYEMQSWQHGRQMVLVKNPRYFRAGFPRVPRVVIQFGVDEHLQILRAEKNQLDLPGNLVTSTDYLGLRTSGYRSQLVSTPDIGVWYLGMNMRMKPFKGNLALRRAFNMAIDKSHILRLVNGRAVLMNGILPPTMPGANPHFRYYNYNPAAARAEMRKAGYKSGGPRVSMLYIEAPDSDRVADAVQANLAAIGVHVTLRPVSANTAYNIVYTPGKSAFTLFHWGQDYPDPSDFFDPILSCAASSNAAFYCNHAVDRLGDRARADTNTSQRFAIYRQMEKMVMRDAPWVPLYADVLYDFHSSRVVNFYIHPVWPFSYDQYSLK